ncbi:MAG: hypothetical protein K9G70_10910 [Prolixibacteraceae bacterium]|nr:hypothetical protein [Prolixibacteraceae bacterium]
MIFPSKILLFGEYSLLIGGSGFAIPFPMYGGELVKNHNQANQAASFASGKEQSNDSIRKLYEYMKQGGHTFNFINLDKLALDIDNGLWFASTIPEGCGLGSSGALVAAVYNSYATDLVVDTGITRTRLASIESYYHGSSSGVDPMVAFYQHPLLINIDGSAELVEDWNVQNIGISVYLIDTGEKSNTLNLVDWFKKQLNKSDFSKNTETYFLDVTRNIVQSIGKKRPLAMNELQILSEYQLSYLSPMIPKVFRKHFSSGLNTGDFVLKLCGSGGGGFVLAFVKNVIAFENYCRENELKTIKVSTQYGK